VERSPRVRVKIVDSEAVLGTTSMHWRRQGESGNDLQAHRRPSTFRLAVLALIAFALWRKKRDHREI